MLGTWGASVVQTGRRLWSGGVEKQEDRYRQWMEGCA